MDFILEKNTLSAVEKIPKDIEKHSVQYTGYTLEGEEITVFDKEGDKLAPYVRYLMENEVGAIGVSKWVWLFGILGIVGLVIGIWIFGGEEAPPTTVTPPRTVELTPINEDPTPAVEESREEIKEPEINNELEQYKFQKQEAEMEAVRVNYELERKNFNITKLNDSLKNKDEEIRKLTTLVNNLEKQIEIKKHSPEDAFIYHLGYNVYQKCETTLSEEIKANCKDLYYKFLKKGDEARLER